MPVGQLAGSSTVLMLGVESPNSGMVTRVGLVAPARVASCRALTETSISAAPLVPSLVTCPWMTPGEVSVPLSGSSPMSPMFVPVGMPKVMVAL